MSSRALLLDENLSPRLVPMLEEHFVGIAHVRQFNLLGMPDAEIWRFAREQQYCIVSPDSDFNQLAYIAEQPPQVIWLRLGNLTTDQIRARLVQHREAIHAFIGQDVEAVLELA
jgi:predicted nuclease of predicted toxin-antitoxin system